MKGVYNMLKNFKPIHKVTPQPLIGFECTSTGGCDVKVSIDDCGYLEIRMNTEQYYWSKSDAKEFINNLIQVVKAMNENVGGSNENF